MLGKTGEVLGKTSGETLGKTSETFGKILGENRQDFRQD